MWLRSGNQSDSIFAPDRNALPGHTLQNDSGRVRAEFREQHKDHGDQIFMDRSDAQGVLGALSRQLGGTKEAFKSLCPIPRSAIFSLDLGKPTE